MLQMEQEMLEMGLSSGPWILDPRHDLPLSHQALEGCFAMSMHGSCGS